MKNEKVKQILLAIGIIGMIAIVCFRSVDAKVRINEDVYEMLEYLEIEECVITELSTDVGKQHGDLTAEEKIDTIQNASKFRLSKEQIVAYATNISISATTDYVLYSNITLDEYLMRYHGISSSDFFNQRYLQAKREVEYFLTIGAIAEKNGLTASKEDVEAWCSQNDLEWTDLNEDELCYLNYQIIEEKVKTLFE